MPGITGMIELRKAFKDLAGLAERNRITALKLTANTVKNDVQAKITEIGLYVKGDYRRSIHVEGPFIGASGPYYIVGTNNVAAKQHEFGGVIKAKNKPFLTFKIDGHWVRVKQVYQPPHPHFRPVLQNFEKYQKTYLEALGRV